MTNRFGPARGLWPSEDVKAPGEERRTEKVGKEGEENVGKEGEEGDDDAAKWEVDSEGTGWFIS